MYSMETSSNKSLHAQMKWIFETTLEPVMGRSQFPHYLRDSNKELEW